MIFIGGISSAVKQIMFSQALACPNCGRYGRMELFMSYTYFSFFFIPLFKWGKQYFVKMNCCGATFAIDIALGTQIANGEAITITEADIIQNTVNYSQKQLCPNCGQELSANFLYCPICGKAINK